MGRILSDARYALRAWGRAPTFTLIAIASIGLGIGANSAIFTLVDQVILRVLPVPDPHELVQVTYDGPRPGSNWGDDTELSHPMYAELRDSNQVFSGMFCRFGTNFQIAHDGRTEQVAGELVSGTYFPVLGVGAARGRTLTAEDDRLPGGHPVAVLSHGFWTSRFGSDPAVIGRSMVINGHPYTIVGVARAGFEGMELGRPTQVFVPVMMKAQVTPGWNALDERLTRWVVVFGRLRDGVTPERARATLQPLFRSSLDMDLNDPRLAHTPERMRERYRDSRLVVLPAAQGRRSALRRTAATPLWVLLATAAGVLFIACANVANLLLARGAARRREVAVRLALGATRRRLVEQLLVESVMLGLAGGLAGLALAAVGAPLVLGFFVAPDSPPPVSTSPDARILAFTAAISMLTGVLFGLVPALQSTRPDVAPTLKDQAGGVLGGAASRLRKALVAGQIAVSLLLLIGAGLFLRTLDNLLAADLGFDARSLLSFTVNPALNGYAPPRTKEFAKTLLERLKAAPGVASASLASMRLLDGNQQTSDVSIAGYRPEADEDMEQQINTVGPGYFQTMGIPVLEGREFDERDERLAGVAEAGREFRVAVANQRFVKRYFGDANAAGRRIGFAGSPNGLTPIEIVGVVGDSKYRDVREETERQLFFPYLEAANARAFTVYLRTSQPPETMFGVVRRIVQDLDPTLPVTATRTLDRQVAHSLRKERLVGTMSAIFATLATLLAVVGLYGVVAYTVTRRTREFGIRIALGARPADVGWIVVREGLTIAMAGIAAALPAAWGLSRLVASQLYGVAPIDPATIAAAVVLLGVVSALAGLVPSRRAARIEPTEALRYE